MIVVIHVRVRISAMAIVAAMLVAVAAPLTLTADELGHRACMAKARHCGTMSRVKGRCCVIEQGRDADAATPAAAHARVAPPLFNQSARVVPDAPLPASAARGYGHGSTSPPRSSPPDFVTLFAAFLI